MAEFFIKVADERGRLAAAGGERLSRNPKSGTGLRNRDFWFIGSNRKGFDGREAAAKRKVRQTTFLIFNQQLLTLIKAGLPVLGSLDLLIKRQKDAYFRALLQNVRERVKGGELLSEAFAAQTRFPKDLYHYADGGREERQHGRSAEPLYQFSADGADV